MQPLVTVLIPVYNREQYIHQAVTSILSQSFTDYELLIMDDGSTDNTLKIINSFQDKRIHVHHSSVNRGIEATVNEGINKAKGKYIARMDADDISLPDRLQMQVSYLERHPETDILGSAIQVLKDKRPGKIRFAPRTDQEIRVQMLFHNPLFNPTVMARKHIIEHTPCPYGFRYAEDYKHWVDLADSATFGNLDKVLLQYRIHKQQVTSTGEVESRKNRNTIRRIYLKKSFPELQEEDIRIFSGMTEHNQHHSLESIKAVLEKIALLNEREALFDQEVLLKQLGYKWHTCCRKSFESRKTIRKIHKTTILRDYLPRDIKNTVKYYARILLPFR